MSRKQLGEHVVESRAETLCSGSFVAYDVKRGFGRGEPHERRCVDSNGRPLGSVARSWGDCWKCGRSLGCAMCTTTNELEVLCAKCGAWGTEAAFHHHGPIINTPELVAKRRGVRGAEFREYPERWRLAYVSFEGLGGGEALAQRSPK